MPFGTARSWIVRRLTTWTCRNSSPCSPSRPNWWAIGGARKPSPRKRSRTKKARLGRTTPWRTFISTGGEVESGAALTTRYATSWSAHDVGIQTHLWWHAALFRLAVLDTTRVRSLYEQRVWRHRPDDVFTHTDAISLLWRLELLGRCWDGAWEGVTPHLEGAARGFVFPFLACHYAYALARGGREGEARNVIVRHCRLADARQGEEGRI